MGLGFLVVVEKTGEMLGLERALGLMWVGLSGFVVVETGYRLGMGGLGCSGTALQALNTG